MASRSGYARVMWSVLAVALVIALFWAWQSLRRPRHLPPAVVAAAARDLSLARTDQNGVRLYFDTSGSMRGFALAAAANRRGAGSGYESVLRVLDTVVQAQRSAVPPPAMPARDAKDQKPVSLLLFGTTLVEEPSASVTDFATGRKSAPFQNGGLARSTDCPNAAKWEGALETRSNIDHFFSQGTTCLDQVFEDVLANGIGRLNLVITDAEQNAPLNSRGCPNPKNVSSIQSYLARWSSAGGFAAVIATRLPYQPWQADRAPACDCQERLLYAYVLAPAADGAEQVFSRFREHWRADGPEPSYVPLMSRPALSSVVRVVTGTSADRGLIFVSGARPAALAPPEVGRLPQVWVELKGDEGQIVFDVERAALVGLGSGQSSAVDWSKATLEWSEPAPLDERGQISRSGEASRSNETPPLSLIRFNDALPNETDPAPANVRTARYLGQTSEPEREVALTAAKPLRLRIRRVAAKGCQWFLLEAKLPGREHVDQVLASLTGLSSDRCLTWGAVRDQVDAVFQSGPVLRLLLHVDY
jgi:hypothetical protein